MSDIILEEFKRFKEESGWSHKKIARLLGGMSVQSISNWLVGRNYPSRMAYNKIRDFLTEYSYKKL